MERKNTALIVIDVQNGFDRSLYGPTANPHAEANVSRLIDEWAERRLGPLVVVRHDSPNPLSPLHPGSPGNELKEAVARAEADLTISKHVNSAFYGNPDLHAWLGRLRIESLVLCGIQTNMCVETTARMAGNLGYREGNDAPEAARAFIDVEIPGLGRLRESAENLMRATAMNLAAGGFAKVRTTADILSRL